MNSRHNSRDMIRFSVAGRVQGVGFRAHSRRAALAAGLTGWAKNCADGSVDILLVGDSEAIAAARQQIISGPRGARVDQVTDLSAPTSCNLESFSIG